MLACKLLVVNLKRNLEEPYKIVGLGTRNWHGGSNGTSGRGRGNVELLVPGLNESKRRIGLNMEETTQAVSEKSDLVGASDQFPSDAKTTDIFEETCEEFVNIDAQVLHDKLGEGVAQDSELSPGLESAYMTANVEFDSEDEFSTLLPVSIDSRMVKQDASILPTSGLSGSDQELIIEIAMAVEEMRSNGSVEDGAFQPSESHTILVPNHLTIDPRDIKLGQEMGSGASATVYEATWLGLSCAVKQFQAKYRRELVSAVKQELDSLIKLRHPHIVMLMGCSFDSQLQCSIVMEKMTGSLRSLIKSRMRERKQGHSSTPVVPFDYSEALDIMKQIALGLEYLHSNGVSHRDLKSDNVLVRDLGHGEWEVKIVDFGASLNIDSSAVYVCVGTGFWRAPEVLRRGITESSSKFDLKAADVYSLAMTFYEVSTGKDPFEDEVSSGQLKVNEYEKVRKGLRPKLPNNLDGRLTELLEACWRHKPEYRPDIKDICKQLFAGIAIVESSGSRPVSQVPKALGIIQSVQKISYDVLLNVKRQCKLVADRFQDFGSRDVSDQVSKALKIIENVQKISSYVWVNKHRCKRMADRFATIGKLLSMLNIYGDSNFSSNMDSSAFDELLTVLRKGEVLVSLNILWFRIRPDVPWTDNWEAFKEIHEEIDTMKVKYQIEGFRSHFETCSGSERSRIIAQDFDKDLEEMRDFLFDIEVALQSAKNPEVLDYLKIDLSSITIKDPIRQFEILNNQGSEETYGLAIEFDSTWLDYSFALKVFIKSDESNWSKNQLFKEVGALMELRHPNIIRAIGFAEDKKLCYLLMEMMPAGDLRNLMNHRQGRPFTSSQELGIIIQITKGMRYLHTKGYVHGDLKCFNIKVKKHKDYIEVKIGGLQYSQNLQSLGGSSEINLVKWSHWIPPEAFDNYGGVKPTDNLLKQADVYSFAMTCYEVVTGRYPYDGVQDDALLAQIKEGKRPELPQELDRHLKGLIESCWDSDPNKRPTFDDICHVLGYTKSSMKNQSGGQDNVSADSIKIPESLKIKPESSKKVRRIGMGASAEVYEVTWLGFTFAMKTMELEYQNGGLVLALQEELNFLIQLRHPHIIQIVGFDVDEEQRCSIFMEFMDSNLRDLIDSRIKMKAKVTKTSSSQVVLPFEFHEVVSIIRKIALGMAYLHSKGVKHRDLKSTNVLCQEHDGFIEVKIVDFGISKYIAATNMLGIGSGFWRAPEILPTKASRTRKGGVNLKAADVYSFAMTCCEILTGRLPFSEYAIQQSDCDLVVQGLRPTLPSDMDSDLKMLIEECWHGDSSQRPDFAEICARLSALPHCRAA